MIDLRRPWGKWIGGLLGFALAGPWGAAMGILIGHLHDMRPQPRRTPWREDQEQIGRSVFMTGVVVLGAKMAKADGRVTRAEIDTFKRVFQISAAQEPAVGRLFDRARQDAEGYEPYAIQLAQAFRHNAAVLEEVLGGLFLIASADQAGLSSAEVIFLKRVAFLFGFDAEDFARIAARAGVRFQGAPPPRNAQAEAFAILGVPESASNDAIKTAYRALIRTHHPDKLMAQGMPAEFVATATEKMKRINGAYDTLSKLRGIK